MHKDLHFSLSNVSFFPGYNYKKVELKRYRHDDSVSFLKIGDYMAIVNYQFYTYPSAFWFNENSNMPDIIPRIRKLLEFGYLTLIIFGAISNTAAMFFSISILKECSMSITFFMLAIADHISVFCNMLPKYMEVMRVRRQIVRQENSVFSLDPYYENMISASTELHSSLNCRLLSMMQPASRSVSAWLIVAMTYFRMMSIAYPIKFRSQSWKFYLKKNVIVILVILCLHSWPLFTKDLILMDTDGFKIKLCHHKNLLGIAFYHFENIFTAMVFPVVPCLLIVVFNVVLVVQYNSSSNKPIGKELRREQEKGEGCRWSPCVLAHTALCE